MRIKTKAEIYCQSIEESARIVAADPERYPGLMQEWARAVTANARGETADEKVERGGKRK